MSLTLIANIENRHGEIVVTNEGFQPITLDTELRADVTFGVCEHIDNEALWICLLNPESGTEHKFQLANRTLSTGDKITITLRLQDLLLDEMKKN